jgi:hypothetical protein
VLAELAIASAAIGAVKEALQGTGDIMSAAKHIGSFFDSKAALQKRANEKGGRSDIESFMALEELAAMEEALKQQMLFLGRPGLVDSWHQFQADAKRKREAEAKAVALAKAKRKKQIWAWINGILITASILSGVIFIAMVVWFIYTKGGNG